MNDNLYHRAAQAIASADALLIGAGAGMGVDSGLPDFRGNQGFWNAYPPYAAKGLSFIEMANPVWFRRDPAFGWGFYGHRLNLYRGTVPHAGFGVLRKWAEGMKHGAFVYTSNVDGHFHRAGFDAERVVEIHGAIDWLQCADECGTELFPAPAEEIRIDEATMRAHDPLPRCPQCGSLARPNVLMFGDRDWNERRTREQLNRLESWLAKAVSGNLVIVECGAGTAIPSVRHFCEQIARAANATLIRLNVREPQVPTGQIGLAIGALEGLRAIDANQSH